MYDVILMESDSPPCFAAGGWPGMLQYKLLATSSLVWQAANKDGQAVNQDILLLRITVNSNIHAKNNGHRSKNSSCRVGGQTD